MTVDPSESLEVWAQRAGCVGYETGGAQYQAGLIRGFDPAKILTEGLVGDVRERRLAKFRQNVARFRLYRLRFLQENMRFCNFPFKSSVLAS